MKIKLVITDLDDTLYDWIDYYVPSFLAMVEELSRITGIDVEQLKSAFKKVHERHRTTEYTFAIEELDVLAPFHQGLSPAEIVQKYESAIKAFRKVRKRTMSLYPGVKDVLEELRRRGVKIAAATEALHFHAIYRLKQLAIEEYFSAIVCHPDHELPPGLTYEDVRFYEDASRYQTIIPLTVRPPDEVRKPDPRFLQGLLAQLSVFPEEVLYVGDSLTKDILLARRIGAFDALARFGRGVDAVTFAELLKITYWTEEDLEFDSQLKQEAVTPTFILAEPAEIITALESIEKRDLPMTKLARL
jgi:phosphoglycolate phosphatase-like HAD superfamily hydrolase